MKDKHDYAIIGQKGETSHSIGPVFSDAYLAVQNTIQEMINRKPPTIKVDRLKDITDKEIYVIAVLEMLENRLWIEGNKTTILGQETLMRSPTQDRTIEAVIEEWKSTIEFTQTNENWKDGRHEGDCTKVPMTCMRCLCENHLETARKFMSWFNTGDYQNY